MFATEFIVIKTPIVETGEDFSRKVRTSGLLEAGAIASCAHA